MGNPAVFISYSHDNEAHEKWVEKLATDLRSHGVDTIFDKWDLRLGADLRFFMEQGLTSSSLVLCICSKNYVQKVNTGCGGAGYEGMIMTQELLQNAKSEYVLCIVKNNDSTQKVPYAFGSKLYVDFSDDSQYYQKYRELISRIYGEDVKAKPPLGQSPFLQDIAENIIFQAKLDRTKYHSPNLSDTINFDFSNNNHRFSIGPGEYNFETKWSSCSCDKMYVYGDIGYKRNSTDYPPQPESFINFDFTSQAREIKVGEVFLIKNQHNHFAAIRLVEINNIDRGAVKNEITFDYYIYTAAIRKNSI